jgi:hypothetical protein
MGNEQLIADLKGTKANLVKHGRCTGGFVDDEGKLCLLGAISQTVSGMGFPYLNFSGPHTTGIKDDPVFMRYKAVADELRKVHGGGGIDLYNDKPSTTDDDIYTLIDKALAGLGGL